MSFADAEAVFACMQAQGAYRFFIKHLKPNDNRKQQIYLGLGFEAIRVIPSHDIRPDGNTFKARIRLRWINEECRSEEAPGAQLILYPKYPEVRLSGFQQGCSLAPRARMVELSRDQRKALKDTPRALLLGITDDGVIFAYASDWSDPVAISATRMIESGVAEHAAAVLYEWSPTVSAPGGRAGLREKLTEVHRQGWIESFRLDRYGHRIPYQARNGAGFTLEGMLGITPNGRPEPDLLGWEIKSHAGTGPITLMTPEPTRGLYAESFLEFMETYGRMHTSGQRVDFTHAHRCGERNATTGLTLRLDGVEDRGPAKGFQISDPQGGLHLYDDEGTRAAGWAFDNLLEHWKRKHGNTAFVSYEKDDIGETRRYRFGPAVTLAEGADFPRYLKALSDGVIVYDPGCNLKRKLGTGSGWTGKRRNQLRIGWKALDAIYDEIQEIDLSEP